MVSIQNISSSSVVGGLSAAGAAGCLYKSGQSMTKALGGKKVAVPTSFQRGLDSVFGQAGSKASIFARQALEAAAWAVPAVLLANVSAQSLDPKGEYLPSFNLGFSGQNQGFSLSSLLPDFSPLNPWGEASKTVLPQDQSWLQWGAYGIGSGAEAVASAVSTVGSYTVGLADFGGYGASAVNGLARGVKHVSVATVETANANPGYTITAIAASLIKKYGDSMGTALKAGATALRDKIPTKFRGVSSTV